MSKLKRSTTMSSAAEIVGSIDDLLKEILLRLPLKSLVRFESVSNHWHNLITSLRSFLISNQNPNPTSLILLVYHSFELDYPRSKYVPFPLDPDHQHSNNSTRLWNQNACSGYVITQSCNGLHLVRSTTITLGVLPNYYVCNPTTNKSTALPQPAGCRVKRMYLAFDPAKSPYYKVVCIGQTTLSSKCTLYQVYLYSSDTRCWRISGGSFTLYMRDFEEALLSSGVYWNGNIHWLNAYHPQEYFYFDIECQMFKEMPRPPLPVDTTLHPIRYYFGETSGHLYFVPVLSLQFNVYELKRDYSEWFIKYHVDLSMLPSPLNFVMDLNVISVIHGAYNKDDPFLIVEHTLNYNDTLYTRYNIVSKTSQTLQVLDVDETDGISNVFPYMESLCSV